MSMTFAQNKENIKNYMVQFLTHEGKVSKTYFGLELGKVCRTPTRGRTKLLLDAYPDVFVVEGDKITLCHPSPLEVKETSPVPETPPYSVEAKNMENLSDTAPHMYPQQFSNSVSVDSYDSISHQATWETEQHWYNQQGQRTPTQFTPQSPFPMYSPPNSMTYSIPPYDSMWGVGVPSQGSLVFSQPPHHQQYQQQQALFYSGEYGQQFAQAPYNAEMHKMGYQNGGDTKQGELCEYRPPQEAAALDILSQNNGSMELAELVQKLGVHENDEIGQQKVCHFLSNCSSVTVEKGMAYVKENPVNDQHTHVTSMPDRQQSSANNNNNNNSPPTQQSKPSNNRKQASHHKKEEVGEKENNKKDESKQGGDPDHPRDDDVPTVGAKTVRIGSIHVDNVNIQTVNLHLHVDEMKKTQIGDLVQLQSQIEELFQALSSSNQTQ